MKQQDQHSSVRHIMAQLDASPKLPFGTVNYAEIVSLSQQISEQEHRELQMKLAHLRQLQHEDQALFTKELAKTGQFQHLRQEMEQARLELLSRKSLIEQEINYLEASRRVFEGGKATIGGEQAFLQGGFFASLLAEVAQEDHQIEIDAGADKLSAHINLLQQAKLPAQTTLAQYHTRLAELDQEIRVYDADISSQNEKIKKTQGAIDHANKELSQLTTQNTKLEQQLASAEEKLLLHNASLDSNIYKSTQDFESEYQRQIRHISEGLQRAEEQYNSQKAGATGALSQNIKDSTDELNRQVEHARNTVKKLHSYRVRNGNTGFPRYATRWKTVEEWVFDPDKFNQEKARLEGEHNSRVHQHNVNFNQAMTGPNNTITAARSAANNNTAQLAGKRQASLNLKLEVVRNSHRAESERLAAEVARLKPLVDHSQANVKQKQQAIDSLTQESSGYQQILQQLSSHRHAANGRRDDNNRAKLSIEKRLQEIDQEIVQAKSKLPTAKTKAVDPGSIDIKFDKPKYEKLLSDLQIKRVELKEINQRLTDLDIKLQQLDSEAVLSNADDVANRAQMISLK